MNTENDIQKQLQDIQKSEKELIWANVFHDTIIGSTWLKNKSFSPGRWAVGYPYLYVLYRCLNEIRPKNILELGIGQTTRMISQYAAHYKGVEHIAVDHDADWVKFFKHSFKLPVNTSIQIFDLEKTKYKEDPEVLSYSGFSDAFENKKFDLISIDAPFGGPRGGKIYARIDVCRLLPSILSDSFVIMLDDVNRKEDNAAAKEISDILHKCNVNICTKYYKGEKDMFIAASENLSFLTTM